MTKLKQDNLKHNFNRIKITFINWIGHQILFPLGYKNWRRGHWLIIVFLSLLLLVHILIWPVQGNRDDLYQSSLMRLNHMGFGINSVEDNLLKSPELIEKGRFIARDNNLWINIYYYHKYYDKLKKYFGFEGFLQIPTPLYPTISFLLKPFLGYHLFVPINFVDIATQVRKGLSSGITIRSKNHLILNNTSLLTKHALIFLLEEWKTTLKNRFQINLVGEFSSYRYGDTRENQKFKRRYPVNYQNFVVIESKVLDELKQGKIDKLTISLSQQDSWREFSKDSVFYPISEQLLPYDQPYKDSELAQRIKPIPKEVRFQKALYRVQNALARVYTICLKGSINQSPFSKTIMVRLDDFPSFETFFSDKIYDNLIVDEILVYESSILKYRSDGREFINATKIPDNLKRVFVLVEDDYFYIQPFGINFVRLLKATYNYFFIGVKKGNASIAEQIYEMYLGKRNKGLVDKFVQILGAAYLVLYSEDRESLLNLYIQSIPGSFYRDHNYGVKGIVKNYLNRNSLDNLSIKEMAWLSRIGLLPNLFGQDYIRYHQETKRLIQQNLLDESLLDEGNLKLYAKDTSPYQRWFELHRSYLAIEKKLKETLSKFLLGNELIPPILSRQDYSMALDEKIVFEPSQIVNRYQSYTDQTIEDLEQYVGEWGFNGGLDVIVDWDERAQKIIERRLKWSTKTADNYRRQDEEFFQLDEEDEKIPNYGGASVLVKTHHIQTGELVNKIVAIASGHPDLNGYYYNWAVRGQRHFGSIFKWPILMLYLENKGTLLDTFYDIPRVFEYEYTKNDDGLPIYKQYRPDNWKRADNIYGYYTYKPEPNLYNFIKSKNNTFVKIAEEVGLENISQFLNLTSYLDQDGLSQRERFLPIYPIVLGAQGVSNIRFAQINSVILNKGLLRPLTTINSIVGSNGKEYLLDLTSEQKQVVSREAAEAALFAGYINTYLGTARRFIRGGVGKTGSSDSDVSFLGMTARTPEQFISNPTRDSQLLNYNLLYLVNIGVNKGKLGKGLFGSNVPAINARKVFRDLLDVTIQKEPIQDNVSDKEQIKKEELINYTGISGDFTKYFSQEFEFRPLGNGKKINNQLIKVPILAGRQIKKEQSKTDEELYTVEQDYKMHIHAKLQDQQQQEMELFFQFDMPLLQGYKSSSTNKKTNVSSNTRKNAPSMLDKLKLEEEEAQLLQQIFRDGKVLTPPPSQIPVDLKSDLSDEAPKKSEQLSDEAPKKSEQLSDEQIKQLEQLLDDESKQPENWIQGNAPLDDDSALSNGKKTQNSLNPLAPRMMSQKQGGQQGQNAKQKND